MRTRSQSRVTKEVRGYFYIKERDPRLPGFKGAVYHEEPEPQSIIAPVIKQEEKKVVSTCLELKNYEEIKNFWLRTRDKFKKLDIENRHALKSAQETESKTSMDKVIMGRVHIRKKLAHVKRLIRVCLRVNGYTRDPVKQKPLDLAVIFPMEARRSGLTSNTLIENKKLKAAVERALREKRRQSKTVSNTKTK